MKTRKKLIAGIMCASLVTMLLTCFNTFYFLSFFFIQPPPPGAWNLVYMVLYLATAALAVLMALLAYYEFLEAR